MSQPTYTKVNIMVPSLDRVGAFPCMVILCSTILIYIMSLQEWFSAFPYLFDNKAQIQPSAVVSIAILSIPCQILFIFIMSQIRKRRNLKFFNIGSIVHLITFLLAFGSSLLYILTHVAESISFIGTFIEEPKLLEKLQKIIDTINSGSGLGKLQDNEIMNLVMVYLGGYSFLFQFFVAMIIATHACAKFGERELVLYVRDQDKNYTVVVQDRKLKKQLKKLKAETKQSTKAAKV